MALARPQERYAGLGLDWLVKSSNNCFLQELLSQILKINPPWTFQKNTLYTEIVGFLGRKNVFLWNALRCVSSGTLRTSSFNISHTGHPSKTLTCRVKLGIKHGVQNNWSGVVQFQRSTCCIDRRNATNLSLLNGVHPAGRMLLSITVFKNTVVAKSFQGRPKNLVQKTFREFQKQPNPRNISGPLLLSYLHLETDQQRQEHPNQERNRPHSHNSGIGYICPITISWGVRQVGSLPCDDASTTGSIGKHDLLKPAESTDQYQSLSVITALVRRSRCAETK